jgi:hypothetical protein
MLQLRKVSVVILAANHNPTIISPDWVRSTLSINEKEQNFVHTPPFSLFDSASFLLTVDPDRWELVSKILDDAHILLCGQAAAAYFETLPHIPYKKLGLNYIWAYSPSLKEEHLPRVSLKIDEVDPNEIFGTKSLRCGGTIEAGFEDYILKLSMQYENGNTLVFNYNFSHDVQTWNTQRRVSAANTFLPVKTSSEKITNLILAGKGAKS